MPGGSSFSRDDYAVRSSTRAATATAKGISVDAATFAYDHDVRSGKAKGVHKSLDPKGVGMRESRDSDAHPVTVPIIVGLDTTGSMGGVPRIIQKALPKLMGAFLDDKVSGKKYLGDGYPAIMVAAVDDYDAQISHTGKPDGTLQVGQFESGIEIDDNLSNLWFTANGGGTYEEEYGLLLYFAANHTVHDHWEKRQKKGYLFIIGDEKGYKKLASHVIKDVIGTGQPFDTTLDEVVAEAKKRYHVFFICPNMSSHYSDPGLYKFWMDYLGQQNVLKLSDPEKICEMIVSAVAICEQNIDLADLAADNVSVGLDKALAPLAKSSAPSVLDKLPKGKSGGNERL